MTDWINPDAAIRCLTLHGVVQCRYCIYGDLGPKGNSKNRWCNRAGNADVYIKKRSGFCSNFDDGLGKAKRPPGTDTENGKWLNE